MTDTTQPLDLSVMDNDYEIIGELSLRGDARAFIATRKDSTGKRRDDNSRVIITVSSAPAGDEGNALAHFAADTQLLTRLKHRRLLPIMEGRWIGTDAFAVVSERTNDTSLAELIAHGDRFSNPRAAAILREANGLLEWARDQKIVHRSITADSLFLEPGTDRVRISFVVSPIARAHHLGDDVDADARTIVKLAVVMLTGSDDPSLLTMEALADARRDLPERVIEAGTALLDEKKSGKGEKVTAFLALVGMADPIAAGESEVEKIRAEILEVQRAEHEKLVAERAHFERTMADDRGRFITERADLQRAIEEERAALLRAAEEERADLMTKRLELERELEERRTELEAAALHDRKVLEELREKLRVAGELEIEAKRQASLDDISFSDTDATSVLDENELAPPGFVLPPMRPLKELVFDDMSPRLLGDDDTEVPSTRDYESTPSNPAFTQPAAEAKGPPRNRVRALPLALIGAVTLTAVVAVVVNSRRASVATDQSSSVARAATPSTGMPLKRLHLMTDSANGATSVSSVTADSTPEARRMAAEADSSGESDSTFVRDSIAAARARRAARIRRDSIRRDSLRLDSLARPDTETTR
ncbi:MAG: hypothetical protein ABJE47_07170 [bacterium]